MWVEHFCRVLLVPLWGVNGRGLDMLAALAFKLKLSGSGMYNKLVEFILPQILSKSTTFAVFPGQGAVFTINLKLIIKSSLRISHVN